MVCRTFTIAGLLALGIAMVSPAEDWPIWRYDAGHTGVSPQKLPEELSLQWTLELPRIAQAWPDDGRLEFDIAYEPIIAADTLYLGSPHNDAIMAFYAASGAEKWRFYTDGPVRFAPAVAGGSLYAGSDDGFLYCLDAASGALRWRFQAALSGRKVLGNKRLISVWPVRGAPVVADGVVYFAAGIWPFEGVSVYALDAGTGAVRWINDDCDVKFMIQPHHSPAFSGLAPQGYLAVTGDKLLVPNGRAPAACLDRNSGKLVFYELADNNRFGDYRVSVSNNFYVNPGALYPLDTGANLGAFPSNVAMDEKALIGADGERIVAYAYSEIKTSSSTDKKERIHWAWEAPELWALKGTATNIILAGGRLYACKEGGLFAVEIPSGQGEPGVAWEVAVEGTPVRLAAASGRLFTVTLEGRVYCFGDKAQPPVTAASVGEPPAIAETARAQAREILEASGVTDGYALVLGAGDGSLAAALAAESQLHIVSIGKTPEAVSAVRSTLDAMDLYGARAALFEGDLAGLSLPPYFAGLAVVAEGGEEIAADRERVAALYEHLRPYGGVACFFGEGTVPVLEKTVVDAALAGAQIERKGRLVLLRRSGPLPGSANWTHQYADASNSLVSQDARVRAPLGLLWFGGSSNKDILPRHGHGPSEHVVDGRLFIEGPDVIRAADVYTGRVLWQASLPEIGKAYDNTTHQPGANALGSNYVSISDGIYVAYGERCLRLDPATGKELSTFTLPRPEGSEETPDFGYIGIWDEVLVAGSGPLRYDEELKGQTWNAVASKRIVAMNRNTGEVLWSRTAEAAFRHNAIALGDGKVFCIDRATDELRERLARRGVELPDTGRLFALDLRTGRELWRVDQEVFGTWLSYSREHGLLLQAGRGSRDMLNDDVNERMTVHRAGDGSVVWDRRFEYEGPCMLHGGTILAQKQFFNLLTGNALVRRNPLTGAQLEMTWQRTHGCNSAVACQNLVTFRSAAAGFFDLENDGGTGNLGGFRSGCTSNLIAANGVLNAPDYTRTCTCSYQNQTSLALIHEPEVEMWTYNAFEAGPERIKRLGVNFGAPGDHRDENGTLWLDYPSVGGESPDVEIVTEPAEPVCYRYHSQRIAGAGPARVAASGMKGLRHVRIMVEKDAAAPSPYTVRLYFAEPGDAAPGGRVFDVSIQGNTVLENFDIVGEAGGAMRTVMKEFTHIAIRDILEIALVPKNEAETLLCGIELEAQE